jgi:EAL domain-containing protein (putative c-di-GMP-specific phosphodiesterase class I)
MEALQILVIEDHSFQRKVVVHMLQSLGVREVAQASNGKQALEMLDTAQIAAPDIIFCDLEMPEMDGMEFLRHLSRRQPGMSVVIMSGMDNALITSVEKMALSYGLRLLGAVEKPSSLEQVEKLLKLHQVVRRRRARTVAAPVSFTLEEVLQALHQKQFEPYLQPKVSLKSGRVVGAEALARWVHPKHGVIAPHAFIPLLEQSGNMDEFTFLLLGKTATVCRQLHAKGHTISLSVNLSLSSLGDTKLADKITQMVRDAGVDPHHIILEVTESAAMTNVAEALENLARLRMRGFGLSIDDYGTGFSSMQQLTRVPFTELKIDKSFVADSANNHALRVIVESSIDMAHRLNVRSVAEGVEKQEEWDMLKEMSCDVAQGYLIAKPMDCAAFFDFCDHYPLRRTEAFPVVMQGWLTA